MTRDEMFVFNSERIFTLEVMGTDLLPGLRRELAYHQQVRAMILWLDQQDMMKARGKR